MPIVFDHVTGEVVAEAAGEPQAADSSAPAGEDALDKLRRDLELMHERRQRRMAD